MKLWMAIIWLTACKTIDAGKYAPDPGNPDGLSDSGASGYQPIDCDEYMEFSWVNFGEGFFVQNCNGCHHSESPERYGAPEDASFDTVDDVWLQKGMVLAVASGPNPSMPPSGGATELERLKLEIWLTCSEPGT